MWKNVTEWSAKRKVILFVIVGFLVLAAIGQLTGWWSSEPVVS